MAPDRPREPTSRPNRRSIQGAELLDRGGLVPSERGRLARLCCAGRGRLGFGRGRGRRVGDFGCRNGRRSVGGNGLLGGVLAGASRAGLGGTGPLAGLVGRPDASLGITGWHSGRQADGDAAPGPDRSLDGEDQARHLRQKNLSFRRHARWPQSRPRLDACGRPRGAGPSGASQGCPAFTPLARPVSGSSLARRDAILRWGPRYEGSIFLTLAVCGWMETLPTGALLG
jgi:hypothetical protein